jgi:hypothetical protein
MARTRTAGIGLQARCRRDAGGQSRWRPEVKLLGRNRISNRRCWYSRQRVLRGTRGRGVGKRRVSSSGAILILLDVLSTFWAAGHAV